MDNYLVEIGMGDAWFTARVRAKTDCDAMNLAVNLLSVQLAASVPLLMKLINSGYYDVINLSELARIAQAEERGYPCIG